MSALAATIAALVARLLTPEAAARWHREPVEAARTRLASLAVDVAAVVEEAPPVLSSPVDTAALLLAIAHYESGLNHRVESGRIRGDGGRSVCLLQINLGPHAVSWGPPDIRSWRAADLLADRRRCLRAGLEAVRLSLHACRSLHEADRLSVYTSGRCRAGEPKARARWALARALARKGGAR